MNLPNKLTIARICMVPFFLIALLAQDYIGLHYLWALILFAAASYTDRLDGKIARKTNQITDFGKFMDPLADKILVLSALVCFVQFGLADSWVVVIILAREFMVTGIRLIAAENGRVLAANKWGKAKTVSQVVAITAVLMFQFLLELVRNGILPAFTIFGSDGAFILTWLGSFLVLISAVFAVVSGMIYLMQNIQLIDTTK
ncbi:CDP-diacylglycerol--glycerol-3-phosphate 3-phosphatidyltransferase [Caproicibacter sp.]|uniref:CDP-diacylglycerol--glycerol-3-phosphate 3-phosphatidyltransferase n=1 Tax=Caproicibacter sp. TaxID=2814884 RepID=UPI003988AE66